VISISALVPISISLNWRGSHARSSNGPGEFAGIAWIDFGESRAKGRRRLKSMADDSEDTASGR
jgi:hypothetical protein